MRAIRSIAVIAPMLDERAHIEHFVRDVAEQDFEGSIRVLVADGGSTDGSIDALSATAKETGLDVEVVPNPGRLVSPGLNACLARAHADLIVRLDCHARYPPDYLRLCAETSAETGAWNVGGVVEPSGESWGQRAVACAMSSAFGGIGWTRFQGGGRTEVDTVTYGAFRPEAFEVAGEFDPSLVRNQDDEFNLRIRRAGGNIVLDPRIRVRYAPRGSWRAVFRQYYEYGFWKIAVMAKHRRVLSLRSLAPALFVLSLAGLAATAPLHPAPRALLAIEGTAYALAAVVFAAVAVRRRSEPVSLVPRTVATFVAFHVGYGVGMISGLRIARHQ